MSYTIQQLLLHVCWKLSYRYLFPKTKLILHGSCSWQLQLDRMSYTPNVKGGKNERSSIYNSRIITKRQTGCQFLTGSLNWLDHSIGYDEVKMETYFAKIQAKWKCICSFVPNIVQPYICCLLPYVDIFLHCPNGIKIQRPVSKHWYLL